MSEFFSALAQHRLLQMALAAGVLASLACGVVGTFVVVRRITYIAGGISHSVLGGLGAAKFLSVRYGWGWLSPMHGAVVAALASAMIIGWVSLRAKEREDTVIGAVWAIGMALGVFFIQNTPGYSQDLMTLLFGNILMVRPEDLKLIALLDVAVVGVTMVFYKQFLAVCFDEEFARLRGLRVEGYYLLLLALTALAIVLLISVVGIVLVIALLTLPVAVAGHFARKLWQMMVLASLLSMALIMGGMALSYGPDMPTGATTILLAGLVYLLVVAGSAIRGR